MNEPAIEILFQAFAEAGGEARFVGGAVRDALLGRAVGDVDFAATLSPEAVSSILRAKGFKVVPTGIEHGTVTAVFAHKSYEITTLRKDIATDGRHATVAYTDRWEEDAQRRDFTINALFADKDGALFDYVGGLKDLEAGVLRFIGDPAARIEEDHLRILRFFRFYAQLEHEGKPFDLDNAALSACGEKASLLGSLSIERIGHELRKLLGGVFVAQAWDALTQKNLPPFLLPEAQNLSRLKQICSLSENRNERRWLRNLASLLDEKSEDNRSIFQRLRFSKAETEHLLALQSSLRAIGSGLTLPKAKKIAYRFGKEPLLDALIVFSAHEKKALQVWMDVQKWDVPTFPLRGADILDRGLSEGPLLGKKLQEIEDWWIENEFAADRNACLAELAKRV
jgi:poly(A) polymerase